MRQAVLGLGGGARPSVVLCALAALLLRQTAAVACDICAVYTATELQESRVGLRLGVAEQFSDFATLQDDGETVPNPDQQYLESSITQLLLGYTIHPRISLQLAVPIIDRTFRRPLGTGIQNGNVSGIGDITLVANGLAYSYVGEASLVRLSGLFGLKFPSGNPDELAEEDTGTGGSDPNIPPIFQQHRFHPRHTVGSAVPSGIHGHDLALGSGSTDVIFGAGGLWTYNRAYADGGLQYVVRTTGAFGYRYANDLTVTGGPGVFVLLEHNYTLGLQAVVTCETKGTDSINGEPEPDTALTALYAGPGVHFTWGSSLTADVVADLPAIENNSGLQVVADWRLRGGVVWRF